MPSAKNKHDWNMVNCPPEGHADVGKWAWNLYEIAKDERERLGIPDRWMANYQLYRGYHGRCANQAKSKKFTPINLYFANVERTKANITARKPVAEVLDMEGYGDGSDNVLSAQTVSWWKDTKQQKKLSSTVLNNEIYGITIEKPYWDKEREEPNIIIVDPFAFFPAPGNYEDISTDAPYVAHAYPETCEVIEVMFGAETDSVKPDDTYSVLGEEREDYRPVRSGVLPGISANAVGNYSGVRHHVGVTSEYRERRALVIEVWVRDFKTIKKKITEYETRISQGVVDYSEYGDEIMGNIEEQIPVERSIEVQKYPDGLRVITVTNGGDLVLQDSANPNLNHAVSPEISKLCHAWGRFPFSKANSYEDTSSIWGFAAAEQVADLNLKIDEIISRMINYILRVMNPPLVVPQNIGITKQMINNKPGLVLMPTNPAHANSIHYVQVPNLPSDFFNVLDRLINFFDRIYQIEDADRGNAPSGVIAASAIVALQERNAVLIQQKINAVDFLVEQRGSWAISMWQNFGVKPDSIDVNGDTVEFRGVDFIGRQYGYIVESGSTTPKTSLQAEAQSEKFYGMGAIDRQALLENSNYPGWKEVIERVGEGQLGQALQVLVQAGLPEEQAQQLQQFLMQSQGGPGNSQQTGQAGTTNTQQPQPGKPRAMQGQGAMM